MGSPRPRSGDPRRPISGRASDQRILGEYLGRLQSTPISDYNRREQQSYWITLYKHLRQYARGELAERLKDHDGRLEYSYDWELNEP